MNKRERPRTARLSLRGSLMVVGGAVAVAVVAGPASAGSGLARAAGDIERVSVSSAGMQAERLSDVTSVSTTGRFVVFSSPATRLVPGHHNAAVDVFVRDLARGTTRLASIGAHGEADGDSSSGSISADGRFVSFCSRAANLVDGDRNRHADVFVRDLDRGRTMLISSGLRGAEGNDDSCDSSISANGRYVVFVSDASNLVARDSNGERDVFVRDLRRGTTSRVSVGGRGEQADNSSESASISADGTRVAFSSDASNLVRGDRNRAADVFVRDLRARTTALASVSSRGRLANGPSEFAKISGSGRYVVFSSIASNLVDRDSNGAPDVFVRDLQRRVTVLASLSSTGRQGNGDSIAGSISDDGRLVGFFSSASNLVRGDTNGCGDAFVRDTRRQTTSRLSVAANGAQGNAISGLPLISGNGRIAVFSSLASNLVRHDTNGVVDVFARTLR